MVLKGTIMEHIVKLEMTIYRNSYGTTRNKANVMFRKALYGMLKAALSFWKLLSNTQKD